MTSSPTAELVDRSTSKVLGVDAYLETLEPDSEIGERRLRRSEPYRPGERDAWRAEIDRLETVEQWAFDNPEQHAAVRRALARLPDIRATVTPLIGPAQPDPLSESALFTLKQFLYFGARILDAGEKLLAENHSIPLDAEAMRALSSTIHPGGAETPRFHLSGELDSELERRIERRRTLQRELRDHRDAPDADQATVESLESQLESARQELEKTERSVRRELTGDIADKAESLREMAGFLGDLDLRLAKARLKSGLDACWGTWSQTGSALVISAGREPRIARMLEETEDVVQPIDLDVPEAPLVITGPNMGGKSALLQLVGLAQWCAQHAMPVPADAFQFAPVETIFYVGSEEPTARDASEGLSAFGREVRRLVDLEARADDPSLWLLDEVGRGTHPDDGADLAIEIVEKLDEAGHRVVVATHFPAVAAHDGFDTVRIRGIVDRAGLAEALGSADTLDEIEHLLRDATDFQPLASGDADVPRDAHLVARALGLDVDDTED